MKKVCYLLMVFAMFLFSCEKDNDNDNSILFETGDLFVKVKSEDGSPVANALVYTNPESIRDTTDSFGSVLLKYLRTGNREVYARVDSLGSGKSVVNVIKNQVTEVEVTIVDGLHYPDSNLTITLFEPIKANGRITLTWSKFTSIGFQKYQICRSVEGCFEEYLEVIGENNDVHDTTFVDDNPPIEYQACYAIKAVDNSYEEYLSNFYSVEYPSGILFSFVPDDMLKHPSEPFVYLVSDAALKLVKYDYMNGTVLTETSLSGNIGFCDIGDNGFGVEIYVPTNEGKVYVYDAEDLSLTTIISTELAATCAVIDGLGNVIVSVVPSPWWEEPIRTYRRENGMNIDGAGERDYERLKRIGNSSEFISISQGVSPTDMNHYKFSETGLFLERNDDPYHGDYSLNATIFRISDNGEYIITSYNGSVYLANSNMLYQGNLQNGNLSFSDFAFSDDASIIYAATSNRKSIQIGHYPSLIRDDEILLSGYPKFIVRSGDKLIAVVAPEMEDPIKSTVTVVDIP
ncbi:MAG: carboxypeptidase regulatory-like domain-containing protein [Bacteroidales bacterium]|nr:carboxypeptidase regulatory-like domain-containing protein [Bacteroidales bacterium]